MSAELEYLPERTPAVLLSTLGLGLFLFETLVVSMTGVYLLYWAAGGRITSREVDFGNTPASLVSFEMSHNQRKESSR